MLNDGQVNKKNKKQKRKEEKNLPNHFGTISPERLREIRSPEFRATLQPKTLAEITSTSKTKSNNKKLFKNKVPKKFKSGKLSLNVLSLTNLENVTLPSETMRLCVKCEVDDDDFIERGITRYLLYKGVDINYNSEHELVIKDFSVQSLIFSLIGKDEENKKTYLGAAKLPLAPLIIPKTKDPKLLLLKHAERIILNNGGVISIEMLFEPIEFNFSNQPKRNAISPRGGTVRIRKTPTEKQTIVPIQQTGSRAHSYDSPYYPSISKVSLEEYKKLLEEHDPQRGDPKKVISFHELVGSNINTKRFRDSKFDLDLAYITDRLIAMAYPSEGKVEKIYRNSMTECQNFLNTYHPKSYKVYNLCSERSYPPKKFYRCEVFPFSSHSPPTLMQMQLFCVDVESWLNLDNSNVAVVHCKTGIGRTATMICCYLVWKYRNKISVEDSFKFFADRRTFNRQGVTASQRRFVHYFDSVIKNLRDENFDPYCLIDINYIALENTPSNFAPYFVIESYGEVKEYSYKDFNVVVKYKEPSPNIKLIIKPCFVVNRETRIEFYDEMTKSSKSIFRLWFHTKFLNGHEFVCKLSDLDQIRDPERFPNNFTIRVGYNRKSQISVPDTQKRRNAFLKTKLQINEDLPDISEHSDPVIHLKPNVTQKTPINPYKGQATLLLKNDEVSLTEEITFNPVGVSSVLRSFNEEDLGANSDLTEEMDLKLSSKKITNAKESKSDETEIIEFTPKKPIIQFPENLSETEEFFRDPKLTKDNSFGAKSNADSEVDEYDEEPKEYKAPRTDLGKVEHWDSTSEENELKKDQNDTSEEDQKELKLNAFEYSPNSARHDFDLLASIYDETTSDDETKYGINQDDLRTKTSFFNLFELSTESEEEATKPTETTIQNDIDDKKTESPVLKSTKLIKAIALNDESKPQNKVQVVSPKKNIENDLVGDLEDETLHMVSDFSSSDSNDMDPGPVKLDRQETVHLTFTGNEKPRTENIQFSQIVGVDESTESGDGNQFGVSFANLDDECLSPPPKTSLPSEKDEKKKNRQFRPDKQHKKQKSNQLQFSKHSINPDTDSEDEQFKNSSGYETDPEEPKANRRTTTGKKKRSEEVSSMATSNDGKKGKPKNLLVMQKFVSQKEIRCRETKRSVSASQTKTSYIQRNADTTPSKYDGISPKTANFDLNPKYPLKTDSPSKAERVKRQRFNNSENPTRPSLSSSSLDRPNKVRSTNLNKKLNRDVVSQVDLKHKAKKKDSEEDLRKKSIERVQKGNLLLTKSQPTMGNESNESSDGSEGSEERRKHSNSNKQLSPSSLKSKKSDPKIDTTDMKKKKPPRISTGKPKI